MKIPDVEAGYNVFISFSANDVQVAARLAAILDAEGISRYFYPETNLVEAENDFAEAIPRYIDSAKVVICVFSRESSRSQYVHNELKWANDRRLPIIPVLLPGFRLPTRINFLVGSRLWASISDIERERVLLVDRVRRAISETELPDIDDAAWRPGQQPVGKDAGARVPYIGPRPFDASATGIFAGRDDEIKQLNWLLQQGGARVLMIYAPSGAGKSSMLMAGLMPRLKAAGYDVPTTQSGPPRVGRVPAETVAGDDTVVVFTHSLILELSGDVARVPDRRAKLSAFMRSLDDPRVERKQRVLILDQFEEIFFEQFNSRYEDRRRFFLDLKEALQDHPTLHLVLALRKEYLAEIQPLLEIFQGIGGVHELQLDPMREEAARQAIARPAAPYVRFEEDALDVLLKQLRQVTVRGADNHPVRRQLEYVELAHLQVVCLRLWRSLPEGTKAVGAKDLGMLLGSEDFVSNVLNDYYEEVVAEAARLSGLTEGWVHLGCAQFISTKDTRVQLPSQHGRTGRLTDDVVRLLETKSVLRRVYRGPDTWFELAHDLLIEPVTAHRARDTDAAKLLLAARQLDQVRDQATSNWGATLNLCFEKHRDLQEDCLALATQHGLSDLETELLFRSSLATGSQVLEWAAFMNEVDPSGAKLRRVLADALRQSSAEIRGHAVDVICEQRVVALYSEVTRLAVSRSEHNLVRSAAAHGAALIDDHDLYRQIVESGEASGEPGLALDALSVVAVRSKVSETEARSFRKFARTLDSRWQRRIVFSTIRTRFRQALPLLVIVFIFGASFAGLPALVFKAIPSSWGWGVAQHEPNLGIGAFQGAVASLFWGGIISTTVTLHYAVFANAKLPRSTWSPFGAVVAGAMGGVIASAMIVSAILGVFNQASLLTMGWIAAPAQGAQRWIQAFGVTRYGWVYLVTGLGLGIGLALISNSIRASRLWPILLKENMCGFNSLADVARCYRRLLRIAFGRRLLLLVAPVLLFSGAAFFVPNVDSASRVLPLLEESRGKVERSKANPKDLALGLMGDGLTQIVGALFGVCGALLGGVIVRSGFSIRPMQVGFGTDSRRRSKEPADHGA